MKYKLLILILPFCTLHAVDWHEKKAEGWIWFEQEKVKEKQSELPSTLTSNSVLEQDPEKELDAFKRDLERKLKIAVWDPTPQNVYAFQKMQFIALEKSIQFSQAWQQNLLAHPELDSSISLPSSQYGVQVQKLIEQKEKETLFHQLAQEYGLIYFYEGTALSSQATAEVVKGFAKKYQWKLYGVAIDNKLITDIENQEGAKKLAEAFNISIFPSLFIVDPENNQMAPIAYGMVSQEKIEENLLMQISKSGSLYE